MPAISSANPLIDASTPATGSQPNRWRSQAATGGRATKAAPVMEKAVPTILHPVSPTSTPISATMAIAAPVAIEARITPLSVRTQLTSLGGVGVGEDVLGCAQRLRPAAADVRSGVLGAVFRS